MKTASRPLRTRSFLERSANRRTSRRLLLETLENRSLLAGVTPPDDLIAWWPAENTTTDVLGGNNGTALLGATFAAGQVDQAFSFDGNDDRVEIGDVPDLKLTNSLTIEAWMNVQSLPVNKPHGHILFRGDDRNGLDPFYLAVSSTGQFKFNIDSLTAKSQLFGGIAPLGQFVHVAATLDDATGSQRIYVNGVLAAETITSVRPFGDLDPASNPGITVGNHSGYPTSPHNYPINGRIDELSVYGRALTPEEIQAIHAAGLNGDGKVGITISDAAANEGTSSQAVFTVSLSSASGFPVTVNYGTADGTATVSSDYASTSGTVTFAPGETSHTIVVNMLDDSAYEGDETFIVNLSNPGGGIISDNQGVATLVDNDLPPTKFYVVNDGSPDRTYEYGATGAAVESYSINSGNSAPRGAASTIAGDKVWVVDANKKVYVYNPSGALLGSWTAGSLPSNANAQGITTNGTDIWIVDAQSDKVYRYTNAASRISGSQNAASSFNLNNSNKDATDLVTDGSSIWVVNNATGFFATDKVFKYTVGGSLLGSWTISSAGSSPTGITLDPSSPNHLWIVDSSSDRVYQFDNATTRTSGSQSPSTSFALASGNTNPQGLADPPNVVRGTRSVGRLREGQSPRVASASSTAQHHDLALLSLLHDLAPLTKKRR